MAKKKKTQYMSIRMPLPMKRRAAEVAERRHQTLSAWIRQLTEQGIRAEEQQHVAS